MKKDICCKAIKNMIASEFSAQIIKHEVYRVDTTNKIDKDLCKKIRYKLAYCEIATTLIRSRPINEV